MIRLFSSEGAMLIWNIDDCCGRSGDFFANTLGATIMHVVNSEGQ